MKKLVALLAAIAMVVTIFPALAETAAIGTPDAPVVVRYLCKDVDPADEDVQKMAEPVLAHRLVLSPEARMRNMTAQRVLANVLGSVQVPVKAR